MSFKKKKKKIFSCHELSWRSRQGEWVNITQNALQHDDQCVVNFSAILKIALTGVRSRVRESLAKRVI